MAFERHQPSSDLRAFLDPLKPGEYFDCGEARLYGIDDALESEAMRRGREVGDDEFQLVATDGGLIFCRASISFAIAARWRDLTIGRPEESGVAGFVLLPISWPTHGDLRFTVSRRLGSNVFRRWLQLQAQATRRHQVEHDARFEPGRAPSELRPSETAVLNGHPNPGPEAPIQRRQAAPGPPKDVEIDLREDPAPDPRASASDPPSEPSEPSEPSGPTPSAYSPQPLPSESVVSSAGTSEPPSGLRLDDADREAILYATDQMRRRRQRAVEVEPTPDPQLQDSTSSNPAVQELDPEPQKLIRPAEPAIPEPDAQPQELAPPQELVAPEPDHQEFEPERSQPVDQLDVAEAPIRPSSLDNDVAEAWIDDRQSDGDPSPGHSGRWIVEPARSRGTEAPKPAVVKLADDEPTVEAIRSNRSVRFEARQATSAEASAQTPGDGATGEGLVDERVLGEEETIGQTSADVSDPRDSGTADGPATTFMARTADGTEIYPVGGQNSGLSAMPGPGRGPDPFADGGQASADAQQLGGPIPEISGARLQHPVDSADPEAAAPLDVRATLLTGQRESSVVEILRQRRALILGLASVVALLLIVAIGVVVGNRDGRTEAVASDSLPTGGSSSGDSDDQSGVEPAASDQGAEDEASSPDSTANTVSTADASDAGSVVADETLSTADSTLRITSTTVQICHSNYGGCVPVAADVDCAGDGDGPAFQSEPVAVFGDDVYDLDTDDDRQACEPDQPRVTAADAG